MSASPLLEVENLSVHFPAEPATIRAVEGVSLQVEAGETLALVGESGCGKSTLARAIVGITPPTGGSLRFRGEPLAPLGTPERRPLLRRIQMVFQDPDGSLNPRLTIGASVGEALELGAPGMARSEREGRVQALLADVGLDPSLSGRYPHELSGGQKQRVCIARALSVEPSLVICDEAVSALDVSIQAQILNLLVELREKRSLSYLFITHDLRVVRHIATRVAVMYLGQIVEVAPTREVFEAPAHPYTRALLSAVPSLNPSTRRPVLRLSGDVPSPAAPPPGCRFHPRCPEAFGRCVRETPPLYGNRTRCFLADRNHQEKEVQ